MLFDILSQYCLYSSFLLQRKCNALAPCSHYQSHSYMTKANPQSIAAITTTLGYLNPEYVAFYPMIPSSFSQVHCKDPSDLSREPLAYPRSR
jgi:hypothetical protein